MSNFTHEVTLPSKGILNQDIPGGKVVQRCMMVADQKFISGSKGDGDAIVQALIKRCTESPENINIGSLSVQDTLFLLFKLRILSYGNIYKYITKCPECNKKIEVSIDLSTLEVDELPEDYEKSLVIVLPHKGDKVFTKIMTNDDFEDIESEVKRIKKRSKELIGDPEVTLKVARLIVRIELQEANAAGDKVLTDPVDILQYVESLTDLDATAIQSTVENLEYGLKSEYDMPCPECEEDITLDIRFNASFFRPKYGN